VRKATAGYASYRLVVSLIGVLRSHKRAHGTIEFLCPQIAEPAAI
jgi:hypothetical protein